MKTVRGPLDGLIAQARDRFAKASEEHKLRLMKWGLLKKAQDEYFKKHLKEKIGENKAVDLESMELKQKPQPPKQKRYRIDDSIVEKLGELLIENPHGLLLFRDEIAGWLHSFEKRGRENDRPFFLQSWSGREDFYVDRIGRGSLYVPHLYLSILGSIHPGPLSQYVY